MISNRSDLHLYLLEDAKVNRHPDINTILGRLKYYAKLLAGNEDAHALRYLRILRYYEYWYNCHPKWRGVITFYKVLLSRYGIKYGLNIGLNMVGYGLRIPHLVGGIIINCESMGNYCGCNSGVVIGSNKGKRPCIGDDVHFAIGSKIYGGIRIGNHSKIAPNTVVFKDVPENAIMAGNPGVIIKRLS